MVERLFVGNHPYFGAGVYISKPGIDARNNQYPENFLLHSGYKTEQIIASGAIALAANISGNGTSTTVYFPEAMTVSPIVLLRQTTYHDTIDLPWRSDRPVAIVNTVVGRNWYVDRVWAESYTDRMVLFNWTPLTQYLQYIVLARGVGDNV